jgi:hypothetical protein
VNRRRIPTLALAVLFAAALPGCLMARHIRWVESHPNYNSYKVQTISVRYAVLTAWATAEVWSCHKDGDVFTCTEVDYDGILEGVARDESRALPEAEDADSSTTAAPKVLEGSEEPARE